MLPSIAKDGVRRRQETHIVHAKARLFFYFPGCTLFERLAEGEVASWESIRPYEGKYRRQMGLEGSYTGSVTAFPSTNNEVPVFRTLEDEDGYSYTRFTRHRSLEVLGNDLYCSVNASLTAFGLAGLATSLVVPAFQSQDPPLLD